MPRFAANLSYLWAELPYLDRFDAAAEAGFLAVEVQQPYDVPAPETQAALHRNGLQFVLLNAPGPNYAGGARGFAAVPGGEARFDYDMRRAVRYAQALGASIIHVMSGDGSGAAARSTLVSNLKRAAATLPGGLTLTLEPLCPQSQPDYFLDSFDLAAEVIDAVGARNVGLQFDSYHAQEITGDALGVFEAMFPLIRHIQIGDAPGRSPPGTGRVDIPALFAAIDARGYEGWVSAEYRTEGRTEKTLDWMRPSG
ncbi:hydroxypyruvate isomerase family protein [Tateyamaria omphalii]|uniref:Hydroxypyruvate isomerase n=1 Tax=Tateyamaria omphalii TaxID=299262 RepID=A0A1P8MZ59_9RHOB|nr:TIM barrel protein [Tateyamaria omphalii]APX13323.1 hydroxypyruvate isomerase [Tateyamaria omphalii]